ncbi:MAG: hypothetical protein LBU53_01385 [Zoogloeaceae bacterium]|jgi:hypothetical protein|nr:hypothetical protein [Zoogloeaceae bacterium]
MDFNMQRVVQALGRSVKSLANPGLWGWSLLPALVLLATAFIIWKVKGEVNWAWLFRFDWDENSGSVRFFVGDPSFWKLLMRITLRNFSFSPLYLFLTLIASVCALPCLLDKLVEREYPHLFAKDERVILPLLNSLAATFIVVFIWIAGVFLSCFFIGYHQLTEVPSFGFYMLCFVWFMLMPVLLLAWLNRESFVFACLLSYATETEKREICRRHALPLFMLGLILALLAYLPILNLLIPGFAALAYAHYCLEALRQLRDEALVSVMQGE